MQKNTLQIIWTFLLLGFTSMLYFLSLCLHIPFLITSILVLAYGYFSYKWLMPQAQTTKQIEIDNKLYKYLFYVIFLAGIAILTNKTFYLEKKYGDWDSWAIWNYHAKFLMNPESWRQLFSIKPLHHPDYPLYLSSAIAYIWRLLGDSYILVPYAISIMVSLCIPTLIYLETYRKNVLIAGLVLMLLVSNNYYPLHVISQYADAPLGLLFLGAFIALNHVKQKPKLALIIAALLGCCIWTKNEGIMLSGIFILFNVKELFAKENRKYFIIGLTLPLVTLIVFKLQTPANDLMSIKAVDALHFGMDSQRYSTILHYLKDNLNGNFQYIKYGVILYLLFCLLQRKWPEKGFWLLMTCMLGYLLVYLFTSRSLSWQLETSLDRIILQITPAITYVIARQFSDLPMPSFLKQHTK